MEGDINKVMSDDMHEGEVQRGHLQAPRHVTFISSKLTQAPARACSKKAA